MFRMVSPYLGGEGGVVPFSPFFTFKRGNAMNPVVIVNTEWEAMLNALVAATQPWNGAKLHLFKNNFVPAPQNDIAAFTEADFTGYAASSAITWSAAGYLPDGTAVVDGDAKTFQVGATPTILNTIYGWYMTDGAGTVLIMARKFDNPVVLSAAGQRIIVLPSYPAYVTQ